MTRQGWEIEYSFEHMGWLVRINGQVVLDEDGKPDVYRIPYNVTTRDDYALWRKQVCASIERMSGVRCDPEAV